MGTFSDLLSLSILEEKKCGLYNPHGIISSYNTVIAYLFVGLGYWMVNSLKVRLYFVD